jgi:hypothetical protein
MISAEQTDSFPHQLPGLLTTDKPMCTTFRHRDFRLGGLIETAEVGEGKAEAGESKKEAWEEDERVIRCEGGPLSRFLLVPLLFARHGDNAGPTLARVQVKRLRMRRMKEEIRLLLPTEKAAELSWTNR